MIKFVVGYLFSEQFDRVLLIRKNRPDWQKGYLNGIGGHVEKGEFFEDTMTREFKEECGLSIKNWMHVCTMEIEQNYARCDFFTQQVENSIFYAHKKTTDEELVAINPKHLNHYKIIPNLRWLIPFSEGILQKNYDPIKVNSAFKGGFVNGNNVKG